MGDKALIPRFTGEGEAREWRQYKARVLATAATKGWQKALDEDSKIPSKDWLDQHEEDHPDYQEFKKIYGDNLLRSQHCGCTGSCRVKELN